jgi:4-amino-4-deoxy-L-arabinose transferase-like glycosyltransferase
MTAVAAPGVARRGRTAGVVAGRAVRWAGAVVPEVAVVALAGVLRLVALARVPLDPYYDAAVRSMGTSWAALLGGAFEPGRRVAIDKPPVDLWLQVLSVRELGFGALALHLPEALGGVVMVIVLMVLLRTLLGRGAALAGGLALAVLPVAVVTARSDTMDAVMAALAVGAAALVARGARRERIAPLLPAGVLLGLAFDVKLAEALLPVVAAGALWLLAAPRGLRVRGLAVGGTAFVATALAWLIAVTIIPLHPRPWALGSTTGSPWRAALVYDGIDRLVPGAGGAVADGRAPASTDGAVRTASVGGRAARTDRAVAARAAGLDAVGGGGVVGGGATRPEASEDAGAAPSPSLARPVTTRGAAAQARRASEHEAAVGRRPAAPGVTRLVSAQAQLNTWFGVQAVAALAALAVALVIGRPWRLDRVGRGGVAALALWLVGGLALCSVMPGLRPRYLECVDPAVAGVLGAGLAVAARGRGWLAKGVAMTVLLAVLAVPAAVSAHAVAHATQDSGRPGALPASRVAALSAYVTAHANATPDETAASAPAKAGQLIARDGRPVLILSDGEGHQLVSPRQLAAAVAARQVRFAWLGDACSAASGNALTGCLPVMRWARSHGRDVSLAAGQPRRGALYDLTRPAACRAASGRTPRSATSPRTVPAAGASAARRASRAPGGRGVRAPRGSRRRSRATRSRGRRSRAPCASPSRGSRRCAATAPATWRRCRRSPVASRRTARPGRQSRGSRGRAAAARDGTAAASGSRRRRARRPRRDRTARTPAAPPSRRRSTRR